MVKINLYKHSPFNPVSVESHFFLNMMLIEDISDGQNGPGLSNIKSKVIFPFSGCGLTVMMLTNYSQSLSTKKNSKQLKCRKVPKNELKYAKNLFSNTSY